MGTERQHARHIKELQESTGGRLLLQMKCDAAEAEAYNASRKLADAYS